MRRLFGAILCLFLAVPRVGAQRIAVETLLDLEAWRTDAGSRLLARNNGDPLAEVRLRGWLAYRASSKIQLLALGEVTAATERESDAEAELELVSLRWLHSRAFTVEAGKILLPIGEFGARRFSNVNPLIGSPDTYVGEYPWGGVVAGGVGAFDYRIAAVSLPAVNERYTPAPGDYFRPVVGLGFRAGPQLHVGVAMTRGPYLGSDQTAQLPAGTKWQDFSQSVVAVDARYSAGHVEARFEGVWSSYEAPTVVEAVRGFAWYGEARATISPRLFAAARFEHNRYPFVLPISPTFWVGVATTQMNGEVGLGYRLSVDALVKASLRKDHWPVHDINGTAFPDGYALGLQFSLHTDITGLLAHRY